MVFQEVPDEVSLAFLVSGCPLRCPGCHSSDAWNGRRGERLTSEALDRRLAAARGAVTCLLFLGGEWAEAELTALLDQARSRGLKTCLYTGLELAEVPPGLLRRLTYVKVGPFVRELGGLDSPTTNQRFIDLATGKILNHRFQQRVPATRGDI